MVVPYGQSWSGVKRRRGESGRAFDSTTLRNEALSLATWDMMRPCLQQLLSTAESPISLSNLKKHFRFKFHVELSETALGYAKLSECLQDHRVQDFCDVRLQGRGYTIFKRVEQPEITSAGNLCMENADAKQT